MGKAPSILRKRPKELLGWPVGLVDELGAILAEILLNELTLSASVRSTTSRGPHRNDHNKLTTHEKEKLRTRGIASLTASSHGPKSSDSGYMN
jgi:hypothetical protein